MPSSDFETAILAAKSKLAGLDVIHSLQTLIDLSSQKVFNPGQSRRPGGQTGGGRWTKPGDGGNSNEPTTTSPDEGSTSDATDQITDDANEPDIENPSTPSYGDDSENPQDVADRYSPEARGWHKYTTGPTVVCEAAENCGPVEMADYLARHSVPGRDPSNPVKDGDRTLVLDPRETLAGRPFLPGGYVVSTILDDGLTIVNQTERSHFLYDGIVVRQVEQNSDSSWSVRTYGYGNNAIPGLNKLNEWQGPGIFEELDRQMRSNIRQHHGR